MSLVQNSQTILLHECGRVLSTYSVKVIQNTALRIKMHLSFNFHVAGVTSTDTLKQACLLALNTAGSGVSCNTSERDDCAGTGTGQNLPHQVIWNLEVCIPVLFFRRQIVWLVILHHDGIRLTLGYFAGHRRWQHHKLFTQDSQG